MVKVIIERVVVEGLEPLYDDAIAEVLQIMLRAPGFSHGESFREYHKHNHYIVVANWVSLAAWQRWCKSTERKLFLSRIRPFLEQPEKSTVLEKQIYRGNIKSNADAQSSEA